MLGAKIKLAIKPIRDNTTLIIAMKQVTEPSIVGEEADEPGTLAESAYRRFHRDILSGRLPPGAPLRSDDARKRYGIGISPLREALSRLVSEGLAVSAAQKGFRVAPLTVDDVMDTVKTRILIEREALCLSIHLRDVEWEARLLSAHHRLSRIPLPTTPGSPEAETWSKHHREFHSALIAGCRSPWLRSLASSLFDHAERHRQIAFRPTARIKRDAKSEHSEIVKAALAGDQKKALELLEGHYRQTAEMVVRELLALEGKSRLGSTKSSDDKRRVRRT
jgi:GntR family carbon starvation induced transcriptional regulator